MNAAIDYARLTERFVAAQLAGDRNEAMRVVVDDGVVRGARVIDLQARVIRAAQREIGRLWQHNRITVADEHRATGISQVVMARLFEFVQPSPRNGKTIAVACVEGEHHDFSARLVADYLDHGGFDVRFYGADLPTDHLLRALADHLPHALALSVTMTPNVGALRGAVQRVRRDHPALPILVGGHALEWSPHLADQLEIVAAGATPEEVIAVARTVTKVE
ncbi:MAG TPA: cobalamin B12-binding domain-containing protein [Kofleriaceae bacterium]